MCTCTHAASTSWVLGVGPGGVPAMWGPVLLLPRKLCLLLRSFPVRVIVSMKALDILFFPNMYYISLWYAFKVLMGFAQKLAEKLVFTVRSFKWDLFWTHQHFSGLHLKKLKCWWEQEKSVLKSPGSAAVCPHASVVPKGHSFNFRSWQNKTERCYFVWEYRDSTVEKLETCIRKHTMLITLGKTRPLLKAVGDTGNREEQVRIDFCWFFFLRVAYQEERIGEKKKKAYKIQNRQNRKD